MARARDLGSNRVSRDASERGQAGPGGPGPREGRSLKVMIAFVEDRDRYNQSGIRLRELNLADNEIVGQTTNIAFAVFAGLVDDGDMDDA